MIKYNNIINKNNLKVDKVTFKNNVTIIDTPLGKFVIEDNNDINKYNYLLSRGFDYFPKIIDYDNDVILFEYIEPIEYDYNEKALDYIKLLSILHNKTSYFVEDNKYKDIYDSLKEKINKLFVYYNNLSNRIDLVEYMSPNEYLYIRNSSIIFSALNYCKNKLEDWFNNITNKRRVVTLINDVDLDNLIKSKDGIYFTSFNNSKVDSPIYDLLNFYNKYHNILDFNNLFDTYESKYKLLKEEKDLLYILISIPETIIVDKGLDNIKDIKYKIDKVYNTLNFLNFKKEEKTSTHKNKDNK